MYNNHKKIVFLFSGQGSQYKQMGQKLFNNNPVFKKSLEKSERIIQQHLGRSLINEIYHTPQKAFDDLLITHPAIVAIEIALYDVLRDMGIEPAYTIGNSLGEFAAAVVHEAWSASTAIEAAIEQAKAIIRNSSEGGMLTVIQQRNAAIEQSYIKHKLFLAADNFDGHFTLAGTVQNLDAFQYELQNKDIQFVRLPVAYPFHTPLIAQGCNEFMYYMESIQPLLTNPKPGFISALKCEEINALPRDYFWNAVSHYNNFPQLIEYMENKAPCLYIDLGPSGTMATFIKYNLSPSSPSKTFQIMTPYQRETEQLEVLQTLL